MSNVYLGYHRTHKNGKFSGEEFYTDTNISNGSEFFVISGNKLKSTDPVQYFLEGKFVVSKSENNSNSNYQKQKTT